MSVQDSDERIINLHYYYYVTRRILAGRWCSCPCDLFRMCMEVMRWSGAGQEIMPYLPDLMNHLLSVLKTSTAVRPRELAISAIGAAGMWHLFLPSTNASSASPVHLGVRPSALLEQLVCGAFFFPLLMQAVHVQYILGSGHQCSWSRWYVGSFSSF